MNLNNIMEWKSEKYPFLTKKPIINNWFRVLKSDIPPDLLEIHKNNLTIKSFIPNYITGEEHEPTLCYQGFFNLFNVFPLLIPKKKKN